MKVKVLAEGRFEGRVGELKGDSVRGEDYAVVKFPNGHFVFSFKKEQLEIIESEEGNK